MRQCYNARPDPKGLIGDGGFEELCVPDGGVKISDIHHNIVFPVFWVPEIQINTKMGRSCNATML